MHTKSIQYTYKILEGQCRESFYSLTRFMILTHHWASFYMINRGPKSRDTVHLSLIKIHLKILFDM